jgi:hypothetical protein
MTKTTLALLLLAACGDNFKLAPDGGPPDAAGPPPHAVVVAGDFTPGAPGVMSSLDLGTLTVNQRVAANGAVGDDPVIRKFGDELFVVNRADGNNVTILDAVTFAVKEQIATGAGSNPQDVAVVGDKLYVPAFGTAGVVVLTRGSNTPATISLASLDPDGKPNCISAYAVGTDVYVACELLDANFSPRGAGKIAVIDSASDTMRTMVTMANANPFGMFEQLPDDSGGDLVIPTVPNFSDFATGCVEKIKPGVTPMANGCLATNQDLEGYVSRIGFQHIGPGTNVMWVVATFFDQVAPFAGHGNLQGYDLMTNCLWPEPVTPVDQVLVDIAVCPNDDVVVADQTMASNGLRVYNNTIERTTEPLAIGLKPASTHGLLCY